MTTYPIKFKYSLDYFEQKYQKYIKNNFDQYIRFWEEFVGIGSIENGFMKGYRFTHSGKCPEQAKVVGESLNKIRKTSYSILVQLILIKETDRSKFRLINYVESIKFVQELTYSVGTLYYYCQQIIEFLNDILVSFNERKISFKQILSEFGNNFIIYFRQFKDWRDTGVHHFILTRALDDKRGISLPKGRLDKVEDFNYEFIELESYFDTFFTLLTQFLNYMYTQFIPKLSHSIITVDGDLDMPLTINFLDRGGKKSAIVLDPDSQIPIENVNVYDLGEIFEEGYDAVIERIDLLRYLPGSGSLLISPSEQDSVYLQ